MSENTRNTILVVDDSRTILSIIKETLEANNYVVLAASNGLDALSIAADKNPDLILLDVMMPGMSGFEVCARLKAEPRTRQIPVVFITASGKKEDEVRGLELGAEDFVHKPIHVAVLLARVRQILRRLQAEEQLCASKESHRILLDNIQTQVWHLADEHTYGAVNKAHADFLGFTPKEIAKRDMYEFLPQDVVEVCRQGNREVFSQGRQVHTEEWVPNASGKQRLLSITKTPIMNDLGIIEYVVCSAEDITDRRLAEQELKEKTALLEAILDNTPDIMSVKRPDLSVVRYNKAGYAFLNKTQEQIEGSRCYELIGRNAPCSPCATREAVKARQPVALEKYVPELDMHLNCRANPILSDEGQVEYTVELIRNITQRKMMEKELRESEERFKTLYNASFGGIAIHDKGVILECNQGLSEITGFSCDELIGMDGLLLIAEQSRELVMNNILAGYEKPYEAFGVRKNGEVYPLRLEARNIPYKGKMIRVVEFRDITEQRQAEDALRESEARYRLLVNNLPDIVYIFSDLQGAIYWSPAVENILGYSVEYLHEHPFIWQDSIHAEDRDAVTKAIIESSKGTSFQVEYRIRDVHGNWRWFYDRSISRQTVLGETFIEGIATDITERKQTEWALRESQTMLKLILDTVPQSIFWKDRDGCYLGCNKAFADDVGLDDPAQINGKTDFDLPWPRHEAEAYRADDQEVLRANSPKRHIVEPLQQADGRRLWIDTSKLPLPDADGEPFGVLGIFDDITERLRMESTLREERLRLDNIIRGTNVGTWEWNVQTGETVFNERWAEIIGYTLDELTPVSIETWVKHTHPDDLKASMDLLERHFSGDLDYYDCEARMKHKSGEWVWVLDRGRVFTWTEDGKPLWMYGTHLDITDRKRAEETILERERQLRTLSDNMPSGYVYQVIIGRDGQPPAFTYISAGVERLHGVSVREVLGNAMALYDQYTPVEKQRILEAEARAYKNMSQFNVEVRYQPVSGEIGWMSLTSAPRRRADGELVWDGIAIDITARKQAEQAIRESEARFKTLFNESPVSIIIHDKVTGEILDGNAVSYRTYGLDSLEALQANEFWSDPPYSAHDALQWIHKGAAEGVQQFEWKNKTINGDVFWEHVTLQPVVIDGEERILSVAVDITERKRAEEKIRTINEQLQKANAEKDMLFTIIAHDLKSPMSGLVASTELLAHQPDIFSEKDFRLLTKGLHKNARITFELLEDLLQWARMNQGGIDYAPTANSLKELINMGVYSAQDLAKRKDITISSDIPQGLTVLADQPMIKTVIRNILFNAIKFTPRRGEISITARQTDRKATVSVQDNGLGMKKQVLSSIFTMGKEKQQLGTEGEKGTGLGLMLCKQFIDQHGGHIWAESEPGKGTTVFFTLPVSD